MWKHINKLADKHELTGITRVICCYVIAPVIYGVAFMVGYVKSLVNSLAK